ncbi:unnamed protein product [Cuscuta campestris]|uniref:XS domain-containing protein n=1 Tax=Cuscuta campestris TaxID=132261 RepID=A0A484MYS5_9ASTE|nr:unnamed protein product [Cuscuta campestris]
MFRSPPPPHSLQARGRGRGSSPQREDRGRRYSPKSDRFSQPRRIREFDRSPPRSQERNLFPPRTQPPHRALEQRHSPPRVSESYYPRNRAIEHPYSPPRASKRHYSPNRALGLPYSPPRASKGYYLPNRLQERPYSPPREQERDYSPRRERRERGCNYSPHREREHFYSPRREREPFYSPPSRVQEQKQSPPRDRRHNRDYVSPMRSQNGEFIPIGKETEGRRVEYFHDLEQSRRMERKDIGLDFGEFSGVGTSTRAGGERWHDQPQSLRVSEGDSRKGDRYGGPSDSRRKYEFTDALAHSDSTSVKHQFSNLDDPLRTDILNGPIDHGFGSAKASGELGSEGRPYFGPVDIRAISAEGDPRRVRSSYEPRSLDFGDPPRSSFDDGDRYAPGQHNLSMKLHGGNQNPFQGIQQLDKSPTERQVLRDAYMETGTLDSLRHSHYGSGYVASSSHLNAFTNRSPTELKNGVNSSFGEDGHIPLDGRRTFIGRLGEPNVYEHNSVIRSPNGKVDAIGNYSEVRFTPTDGHRSSTHSGKFGTNAPSNTRPSEFYSRNVGIGEEYSHQNVSRACKLDPVRSDDFSYREYMTEHKPWDCVPSSQRPSNPGYFEASGALDKGKQEMDILEYDGNNPIHKRVLYKGYRSASELHGHGMDEHLSTFHEKSGVLYRDHNLHLDEIQAIPKSSTGMFKRKHGSELNIRSGFGTILSSHGRSDGRSVHRIQEQDESESSVPNSKKMKANNSKYGKNIKKYNMPTRNRLHSTTSIASRLSKVNKHGTRNIKSPGTRDIKKRLGPQPQDVETSHSSVKKYKSSLKNRLGPRSQKNRATLPWMKNLTLYKESKDQDDLTESLPDQGDDPLESSVTPLKNEPPEDSEDFKQLVHNAFFKFVKHLNETPARRRKYMKQGIPSCLKCIICGRSVSYMMKCFYKWSNTLYFIQLIVHKLGELIEQGFHNVS